MESKVFEELTCALLDKEPDVKNADLFHIDGQSQYGIDSWADMRHELAVVVASSKCYQIITATQVGDWSDDFLKHYDSYWRARNVRRFILAVASPVHERKLSDKVVEEKVRFHALGMEYEVWGPRQFQSKLRHQRGIVTQFLGGYWANVICGEVPVGANAVGRDQSAVIDFFTTSMASLVTALSAEADSKLDSLKARLREETPRGILRELENMRSSAHWSSLAANVRSKCLRYLASAKLQEGDIGAATVFANEADTVSVDGSVMFRALLTAHQGDREGALSLLEDASEPDAQEIRAALLLQAGRLDDVERILDRLPTVDGMPAVEASRLRAFLLLFRGKRTAALSEIRRVEARAPRWFIVRRAGAVIRYANALSKIVGEEHFANPRPLQPNLCAKMTRAKRSSAKRWRRLTTSQLSARSPLQAFTMNCGLWRVNVIWLMASHRRKGGATDCSTLTRPAPRSSAGLSRVDSNLTKNAVGRLYVLQRREATKTLPMCWLTAGC
jgi:hypothetical protein